MNPDLRRGRSGTLSVKATLVIVVGVLAALILISCGIAGSDAWRSYVAATRVAEVNANTDQLLKGLENIQLERGQTNTALQAPAPATAQVRDLIQQRRSQGDTALGPSLAQIAATATFRISVSFTLIIRQGKGLSYACQKFEFKQANLPQNALTHTL